MLGSSLIMFRITLFFYLVPSRTLFWVVFEIFLWTTFMKVPAKLSGLGFNG